MDVYVTVECRDIRPGILEGWETYGERWRRKKGWHARVCIYCVYWRL